jgi:DNA invertase Pin-like site-specific DNA recombinase
VASSIAITDLPAFMLLRKSQADKAEEQRLAAVGQVYDALANQRQALVDLAARDGVTVPGERICTEIKSGASLSRRTDFLALLEQIRSLDRPGAVLYAVNTARISRGLLTERGMLQDLFIDKQVLIRTMDGFTNLSDADQRLLYEFKGALAHHYLLRYKEDVARTRASQVHNGQIRNANIPLGYSWDRNAKQPAPHPTDFPILQRICVEAFTTPIRQLEERYRVPRDRIIRALRSPMICGWPAKTTGMRPSPQTGKLWHGYLPRDQWVWPEKQGDYPTAMDRADWERLQVVLDERQLGGKGQRAITDHWCRDVLSFPQMPGPVGLGTYCAGKTTFTTYIRRVDGGFSGTRYYIERKKVHEEVQEAVRPVLTSPEIVGTFEELKRIRTARESTDEAGLKQEQERLAAQLKNLIREETAPNLHPAKLAGILSLQQEVLAESDRVAARLKELRERAWPLSSPEVEDFLTFAKKIRSKKFDTGWKEIPDEGKRALMRYLVAAVEVTLQKAERGPRNKREITVILQPWAKEIAESGG